MTHISEILCNITHFCRSASLIFLEVLRIFVEVLRPLCRSLAHFLHLAIAQMIKLSVIIESDDNIDVIILLRYNIYSILSSCKIIKLAASVLLSIRLDYTIDLYVLCYHLAG